MEKKTFINLLSNYSFLFDSIPSVLWRCQNNNITKISDDDRLLYLILKKIDSGIYELDCSEINHLQIYGLNKKSFIAYLQPHRRKVINIIQSKLDHQTHLTEIDLRLLKNLNCQDLLAIHKQQLKQRFLTLLCLDKYGDNLGFYQILQKLELGKSLTTEEINWLRGNNLNDILSLVDFINLKIKYKAIPNNNLSLSSHLYKVLEKIDNNIFLSESDCNFLKKRKLTDTLEIALKKYTNYLIEQIASEQDLTQGQRRWIEKNQRQNIYQLGKTRHFNKLKEKYDVAHYRDNSLKSKLYKILQKLEQNQRLDTTDIVYLQEKELFYSRTKLYISYHILEAKFYETDYQKTGNKWNIPNISSHWRKAEQPQKALKITKNIDFNTIKDNKLNSAILTTRGGAFRDMSQLNDAEKCARKAIRFQPSSHHPYTLMGAICFQRYERSKGERWFEEAAKRGASPESIDTEIKKSIERMKDKSKRTQIVRGLLKKDSHRYNWAKKYLSRNSNKKLKHGH